MPSSTAARTVATPPHCVAARLGGDEFGVIFATVDNADDARVRAERILHALAQPYR